MQQPLTFTGGTEPPCHPDALGCRSGDIGTGVVVGALAAVVVAIGWWWWKRRWPPETDLHRQPPAGPSGRPLSAVSGAVFL